MMAQIKTVGFIGIGVMGRSMAGHLMDAGYEVIVYTRTKAKADALIQKRGIMEAGSKRDCRKCRCRHHNGGISIGCRRDLFR
ncbi:hypothetical protein BsIDN1_24870 [Bacillus safensis]|uniref:6-phosphogluconate dehydrogenase NADP-binding domain-containing protein n=1 Tax=Bacillus safensis TaxID=561879 RepID=A0A5S9MA78_BACIA|nr:hypothetical protein BsIDN1_24870 [Bacillus safensis]